MNATLAMSESTEPAMTPITVLCVDDHPLFREGIAAVIGNQQDIVLVGEAPNGREALERFRALHPDVVLMDLQMPEMSGIDAIVAIRSELPNARIVVLTAYRGDVQIVRALKAGAACGGAAAAVCVDCLPSAALHGHARRSSVKGVASTLISAAPANPGEMGCRLGMLWQGNRSRWSQPLSWPRWCHLWWRNLA